MYKVILNKVVDKFLKKHIGDFVFDQFELATYELSKDPYSNSLDISKLKGYNLKYRLRIGNYRFIYEVDNDKIVIVFIDAGNRGDIYKKYK